MRKNFPGLFSGTSDGHRKKFFLLNTAIAEKFFGIVHAKHSSKLGLLVNIKVCMHFSLTSTWCAMRSTNTECRRGSSYLVNTLTRASEPLKSNASSFSEKSVTNSPTPEGLKVELPLARNPNKELRFGVHATADNSSSLPAHAKVCVSFF